MKTNIDISKDDCKEDSGSLNGKLSEREEEFWSYKLLQQNERFSMLLKDQDIDHSAWKKLYRLMWNEMFLLSRSYTLNFKCEWITGKEGTSGHPLVFFTKMKDARHLHAIIYVTHRMWWNLAQPPKIRDEGHAGFELFL